MILKQPYTLPIQYPPNYLSLLLSLRGGAEFQTDVYLKAK